MNSIKKGLGRGLSSLIGETKVESKINKLLLSDIVPNKYQPRKNFDEENLNDLTNSIKERGVIQPIIVRKSSTNNSKYEIIAGERRWLAARKAGLHDIPVVLTDVDDLKSLEFAIVENVQRHDLNPLEEAEGYKRLIDEFSYDHDHKKTHQLIFYNPQLPLMDLNHVVEHFQQLQILKILNHLHLLKLQVYHEVQLSWQLTIFFHQRLFHT